MEIDTGASPFSPMDKDLAGMDVIIVSTNDDKQEIFWQKRLKEMRGILCKKDAVVLAVTEDWPNGAGNGLGTLYAYIQAQEKAQFMYHTDLFEMQKQGASIAIYHTAGIGKRLFPLTASESNNKSAVKLPGFVNNQQITVLESVIVQTAQLAEHRSGRLSVFWGDQIFVPEKGYHERTENHIEILGRTQGSLSRIQNSDFEIEQYGLLASSPGGQVKLLEKVNKTTLASLIKSKELSSRDIGAISLGSFNLSSAMTFALLREFAPEIERREGKLDSDPHFWMPLTLDLDTYLSLMKKHGTPKDALKRHYQRMEAFKERFFQLHSDKGFFSVSDIGKGGFWWDFGTAKSYYENLLKLASPGPEGQAARLFFQLEPNKAPAKGVRVIKDEHSSLINCSIEAGRITNSILIGVKAKSVDVDNCVIIGSEFANLKANNALLYQVKEEADATFTEGTIRADASLPKMGEYLKIYSRTDSDGKKDWDTPLPHNTYSFHEICDKIKLEVTDK